MRIGLGFELYAILPESIGIVDPADHRTQTGLPAVFEAGEMPGVFVLAVEIHKVIGHPYLVSRRFLLDLSGQRTDSSVVWGRCQQAVYRVLCFPAAMQGCQ